MTDDSGKLSKLTIGEYILWHLEKYGEAYVHEMLTAYNELRRKSSSKRIMKYSSFRTIVWNLKNDGYIKCDERDPCDPFAKSFYTLTGKHRAKVVRGRPKR